MSSPTASAGSPPSPSSSTAPATPDIGFPRPAPTRRLLRTDSLARRFRAPAALPSTLRRIRDALAELRPSGGGVRPPRTSLNQPTGPRRRLAVARADLAAVSLTAHAHGGTVNDVVLTAVAGAFSAVLAERGEAAETLVVSVPVSARQAATAARLGNQVGTIPVGVPTTGTTLERLEGIARITRERKRAPRAASAALLGPAFRTLARLGLLHWFIDRQWLVTTFVTNLRGPRSRLSLLGAAITEIIPVSPLMGNVTVAFAALSYAGTLTITVIADPDRCPDLPVLTQRLQAELDALAQPASE